jgi:hypothetical protein
MRAFVHVIVGAGIAGIVFTAYSFGLRTGSERPDRPLEARETEPAAGSRPPTPRVANFAAKAVDRTADVEAQSEPNNANQGHEHPLPPERPAGTYSQESLRTELAAQYVSDAPRTRESLEREDFIRKTFYAEDLRRIASLIELECRKTICQGVLQFANMEDAETAFRQTFLSQEFARRVPDSVSVPTREKLEDGTVRATFYIHPQEVFVATQKTHPEADKD